MNVLLKSKLFWVVVVVLVLGALADTIKSLSAHVLEKNGITTEAQAEPEPETTFLGDIEEYKK